MTASKPLGVAETLDRLARLRQALQDAAAQAAELEHHRRSRTQRERQSVEVQAAENQAQLANQLAQADAQALAEQARIVRRTTARRARLQHAAKTSLQRKLQAIESLEGRRIHEIQRDLLQTERNRAADLAAAEQAYGQFRQTLAEIQDRHAALQTDAQAACRGYPRFLRWLAQLEPEARPDSGSDEPQRLADLRTQLDRIDISLRQFNQRRLPRLFRYVPLPYGVAFVLLGHTAYAVAAIQFQFGPVPYPPLLGSALGVLALLLLLYGLGHRQARPVARAIALGLADLRRDHDLASQWAEQRYRQRIAQAEDRYGTRTLELRQRWAEVEAQAGQQREHTQRHLADQSTRATHRLERLERAQLDRAEQQHRATRTRIEHANRDQQTAQTAGLAANQAQIESQIEARWQALAAAWQRDGQPICTALETNRRAVEAWFPEWPTGLAAAWRPPAQFIHALRFGQLDVDLERWAGPALPVRLQQLLHPKELVAPLLLTFPHHGSLLLETDSFGRAPALAALNAVILRLLWSAPPGRLHFTLIDPVGLGQSFAGITHLADYGEPLIQGRIWTQTAQIEQRLAELNEHLEKVIQLYLRNEYATITDYNQQAGHIAEKYRFLVVADFPVHFSETATRRLLSIAASGARCGVFTLIHWDRRQPPPSEAVVEDLRRNSVSLCVQADRFVLGQGQPEHTALTLDTPPPPAEVTAFIQRVGQDSLDSSRVEVPFAQAAPAQSSAWTLETTHELRVPIGRTGATKLQYLALGQGTRQHGLIAGKTGSGKSTLFHVIVTNLALWCRPEQVEFYLVDFKKGVEFQCYASRRLPHARVVAIESDREFGLSVLERVDAELKRRGELFRQHGAQDLTSYQQTNRLDPLPRTLLIVDEFQEFFVEDDRIAQSAALLLDRFVRQGRAFGIHVLLGSQTLGGAYTLARATLGQMVVRIALQCNEADAYLIMDENNAAPRLLSRPGEAIYNDTGGTLEGNSPFQAVWLPNHERDARLAQVAELARQSPRPYPSPVVFEGNAPANVRDNDLLRNCLDTPPTAQPDLARVWLGAPNSIKGPTEAVFRPQSGHHLLLVGQRDESALALLTLAWISLAAQYPAGALRLFVFDGGAPGSRDSEWLAQVARALPHDAALARGAEIVPVLNRLTIKSASPTDPADSTPPQAPAVFLLVHGLHRFKALRCEDDFGFSTDTADPTAHPGRQFGDLLRDGPAQGLHVIATCDTYANVQRALGRKGLGEFGLRVLFQMSANDSASLIDSPKASALGLHRALFYNETEGHIETFRPYALPDEAWLREATSLLARCR
ncbi:MAG: ATP-binding protein [Verrucomicrobia bacterium]|nr:ATP-binding protein [Verrucomicrobiota bacterium]